jgi:3-oxoadipate enol-lactonase
MKTFVIVDGPSSGLPVVFVHGFPFSHAMWHPQIEALRSTYHTLAYDIRGHGNTETGDGQYTIELFVDDLIGVLDERNIGQAVFVGLSMGGYIILRLHERQPERFKGLVLCDTRSEADTDEAKIRRAGSIVAVKRNGVKAFAQNFVRSVFAAETFEKKPETVKFITSIIENNSPIGIAGTLLALASRTDTTQSLGSISVPTIILVGEHDVLTPVASAEALKQRIHGSRLHVIPHAAHMSNLENPEVFNMRLIEFLNKTCK